MKSFLEFFIIDVQKEPINRYVILRTLLFYLFGLSVASIGKKRFDLDALLITTHVENVIGSSKETPNYGGTAFYSYEARSFCIFNQRKRCLKILCIFT
jgi:hypothetical protein